MITKITSFFKTKTGVHDRCRRIDGNGANSEVDLSIGPFTLL